MIGKHCATRQNLSLKKGPECGTTRHGQGPSRRFAQLDYFLFADNTLGIERTRGASRFTAS
jgi:hypothetical protein